MLIGIVLSNKIIQPSKIIGYKLKIKIYQKIKLKIKM